MTKTKTTTKTRDDAEEAQITAVEAAVITLIEPSKARKLGELFVSVAAIVADAAPRAVRRLALVRIGQQILLYHAELFGLTVKSGITSLQIAFAAADAWLALGEPGEAFA